jgi:hypothetical protein
MKWAADNSHSRRVLFSPRVSFFFFWGCRYIQEMVKGDPESVKQGSGAMMTLNMLNVFVQAAPRMQARTLYNARSFFVPNERACMLGVLCQ